MGSDAKQVANLAVSQRLLTPAQVDECMNELGSEEGRDPEALLSLLERKTYLTAFQIEKLRKGDDHGYFLGNYRLLYKIASGSFGRVYRADEPASGRVVAIKLLRQRWSDKPEVVELFEREGRVGMSLRHSNIVEIVNVGKDPGNRHYIVMEFVEGGNLRDILAIRGKFAVAEALKILEEVTAALVYAFARGVTHRDMKLSNVLISSQGTAKVVDFGLAQIYSSKFIGEDDTQVQRTVDYAGLEKATNAPFGDVRSDIYFIGCVAYEMLSARPPLALSKNKHARMNRERFISVKPLLAHEINGPSLIIPLVENMMSLDTSRRFQTPAQLLDAIKHARAQVAALEGGVAAGAPKVAPTVFIVETDERLQDAFRDKFRQLGYKVLIAGDPNRAVERFRQQPFQGLIVDIGTTKDEGLRAFNTVLERARALAMPCHGFVILNEDQTAIAQSIHPQFKVTVLTRPLKLMHLIKALQKNIPTAAGNGSPESLQ